MKGTTGTIKGGVAFLLTFAMAGVAALALSGNAMADTDVPCAATGMESVSTPRDHYQAGEIAPINGGGYASVCDVTVDVERPDGVVESLAATTDLGGNFALEYQVPPPPGVPGQYRVVVRGLGGAELASTTFEDAPAPQFDIAPSHVPTTGSRVFTAVVRNTANAPADTARCIRITTPSAVTVTSATFVVANPGTGAGQTGNWSLTPIPLTGSNFVEARTDTNTRRGIFGTTGDNWIRFEITANATAAGTNTWTARMVTSNAACASGGSSDQLGVSVGQVLPRQYTADFRNPSDAVIAAPTVLEDASQAYRIRITRTAGTDDLQHIAIALPTCFTTVTGISTTDSGPPSYTAELTDNMFRLVPSTKLAANGQWVQVHFTATAGCATGAHEFRTAAWKNTSPETSQGDIFQLSPSAGHPTLTVLSANVAPTVAATNGTVTVNEGQTANNSGVWGDANPGDTVALTASVGTVVKSGTNAAGTWSWSYPTTDGPHETQVVTITANDGTTSSSTTFQLNVDSVAPSASFNAPASVDEGSAITISLSSPSDPSSADTAAGFEYAFDCGDGSGYGAFGSSNTAGCSTSDNGPRTVSGKIRDKDGGTSTYSASVSVDNVAPDATFNAPASVVEGSSITVSLSSPSDPSPVDTAAGFEYRFSCDDGTTWTAWIATASHSCGTTDNGTTNVKGEVRDKDGGTSTYSASVTVENVAPSATFNAPASVVEGSNVDLSLSEVVDPGSADTHEFRFSCDGGATWTAWSSSAGHACATTDNGTVNVRGQVRDDDGGESAEYAASVTVDNVAPSATFNAPDSVDEGSDINVSLTEASDPSSADAAAGFEYRFSCDDGDTWTDWGASSDHSCPTNDNGTKNVQGQIRDKDGGTSGYAASVTVTNVDPSATFDVPESVDEGSSINLSLTAVVDPGSADTHEFRFSCDGGTTWTAWGDNTHACATIDNGTVHVRGQVRDDDGGLSEVYFDSVTVNNVAPSATFNAPESVNEGSDIPISLSNVVDPGSADTHEYRFSCDGGATWTAWGSSADHACATNDNGARSVKGQVRDDDGGTSAEYSASVTVENVAPSATFNAPESVDEGSSVELSLTDPGDPSSVDTDAGFEYRFSCDGGATWTLWTPSNTHACSTDDNGTNDVRAQIRDKDGGTSTYSDSATVNNVAPTATFNAPASVNEGSNIILSLTAPSDPSSADTSAGFEYAFDCDDGSGYGAYSSSNSRSCPTNDNGTRDVGGKIRDKDGGATEYAATVAVNNVPPTLTSLIPSSFLVLKGDPVTVTGTYTDPGTGDTFTCLVNWDEPAGTPEAVAGGSSSCSADHIYPAQGTYTVSMKVRDDDGGESNTLKVIITVYDPSAGGFVTGGGWITSPQGSYPAEPNASGRANFGFNSQYKKGAMVPTGQTEFQLHFATFNFHSDAYEVLVVSGHKAQYRGTGKVNGLSGYKFVLTAYDGQITGGGGVDRFRIKITRVSDGVVVYDARLGTTEDMDEANPLALGGGSIVIHKAK